ncbi:hypothetical protein IT414_01735 [bacterium]|nr:hypothetical protein [bacterium]
MEKRHSYDENKILRLIYTFFLGLLFAIFVGVGVDTFYPGPESPKMPIELNSYGKELTPQQVEMQREFDTKIAVYDEKMKPYNRNVSIVMLIASVVFLVVSLAFEKKIRIMSDGVMLGGLFSLVYGLARGFASQNSKYVFVGVSVGLVVVLYLGYHRFVRPMTTGKS